MAESKVTKRIFAMRGRNPHDPSDRRKGIELEQRLEPNREGICNTLTTVDKDNMVVESVLIKQATKDGLIACDIGGGRSELSHKSNKKRKGNRKRSDMPDSDNGEYP